MTKPTISVIIPTHNRPNFLCELLESLAMQTYKDFEVIIVNDCGTPVDFVKPLYPELRIKLINLEKNIYHVAARNCGFSLAAGEYIMLADDDDLLLPNHMEKMITQIGDADLAYSDAEIFEYEIQNHVRFPRKRYTFSYEHNIDLIRKFSTFIPSGCLYKKKIHDVIGEFDVEVHHYWDWDFILRVMDQFKVKKISGATVLYAFSRNGDNQSNQLNHMSLYLDLLCKKHNLGHLPVKNFFLLLEEPYVQKFKTETEIFWDGKPFISIVHRSLSKHPNGN